jgi:hypothetical protein
LKYKKKKKKKWRLEINEKKEQLLEELTDTILAYRKVGLKQK